MRLRDLLIAVLAAFAPAAAIAHPHVWVDAASEAVFDDRGRLTAIRHHWRFDEAFSAYALQGLDVDRDGAYSEEELRPLAKENVESLSEFEFFTFVSIGDYRAGFGAPRDYRLDLDEGRLILHFTLPLAYPILVGGTAALEVFDPEYYVAFSLPNAEAVRLVNAPAACSLVVYPARGPDAAAAQALAAIGPEQRELPPEMQALATGLENSADIDCRGGAAAASGGARSAAEAASQMAAAGGEAGDLMALPAGDEGNQRAAATESPARKDEAPALRGAGGFVAWIGALQTAFNRDLTQALKGLKEGGTFWWLGGVSFLYGIAHAAGPGHGKVVISSYLLANEQRVRRGVLIAFLAAFAQAVVAVAIIGVMAIILNATSMAITGTAQIFEAGSFALVAGLGLFLLARKGRQGWAMALGHAHHVHGLQLRPASVGAAAVLPHHLHGGHLQPACDHHHAALPENAGPGLAGAAAAILSVGIRPCSGALVVLVFALAQGIFWAGVASTFLMALGTAVTVAALAALAVFAKDFARRLSRGNGRRAAQAMLGLELLAALGITVLGAVLFAGAIAA